MRFATVLIGAFALGSHQAVFADGNEKPSTPDTCPVTRSTPETRFTPPLPAQFQTSDDIMFWYGSDALYTQLRSDGRWLGIRSDTGVRNKSFWHRKGAKWLREYPYQLIVTIKQLDADGPMLTVPRVTNAIMGEEVAMLIMLELPKHGCWQVTGNYKGDYLSFVTWVD
jgi:hypothetical protein